MLHFGFEGTKKPQKKRKIFRKIQKISGQEEFFAV